MPPQQGYISRQFEPLDDGAKTPMAMCKHCNDKRVAKNIVARKVAHLAACDAYYTHLHALIDEPTEVGAKELSQLPHELRDKIEARTGEALISRPGQAPSAAAADQDVLKDELDRTVLRAIFHGSLPFDTFEPNRHPAIVHLCRLVMPDYEPPPRTRIAQAMMELSYQHDAAQGAQRQSLPSETNSPRNTEPRETSYCTPGSKRPFDLV